MNPAGDHGDAVFRQVFRGHLGNDSHRGAGHDAQACSETETHLQTQIDAGRLLTASLFRHGQRLFFYVEAIATPADIEALMAPLSSQLAPWPGGDHPRHWVPMTDIFHYHRCLGERQWRRKTPPAERTARVLRLRPEMASSYIFLHYQLQEEKPAIGDKYGLIALHEDLMFFYAEEPAVIEAPLYEGHLATHNTPGDWHTLMDSHFLPWDDDGEERLWRPIGNLLSL